MCSVILALSPSHENILVALIGGLGLVLVALIPVLASLRKNRDAIGRLDDHMPPNGRRLYEMVEATDERTARTELRLDRLEVLLMEHLTRRKEE